MFQRLRYYIILYHIILYYRCYIFFIMGPYYCVIFHYIIIVFCTALRGRKPIKRICWIWGSGRLSSGRLAVWVQAGRSRKSSLKSCWASLCAKASHCQTLAVIGRPNCHLLSNDLLIVSAIYYIFV